MPRSRPARTTRPIRVRRVRLAGLLVLVAAVAAVLGYQSLTSSTSTVASPIRALRERAAELGETPGELPRGGTDDSSRELGEADGAVPDDTSVFDDGIAGVAKLDSDLLAALRQAADDAAHDGIELHVDSGWRSRDYQQRLLQDAISKYGSEAEAERWVAPPDTSAHVTGDAVDIGPSHAAAWLSEHGVAYGLCRIYGNEPWHFELRPDAAGAGCPAMYADAAHDPRMQLRRLARAPTVRGR